MLLMSEVSVPQWEVKPPAKLRICFSALILHIFDQPTLQGEQPCPGNYHK